MADLDPVFEAAGAEWNVDPRLLRAVAGVETGGARDPARAVSRKGALGLMQIMPDTARGLGMTDPNDPVQSIWAGAKYLAEALDKEGKPEPALLYYHGGPNWRASFGPESQGYVPKVTAAYRATAPAAPAKGSNMNDADFLAAIGATKGSAPASVGALPDDQFLAQIGAQQPKPIEASASGFSVPNPEQPLEPAGPQPMPGPVQRIGEAAAAGWQQADVLAPEARNWLAQNGTARRIGGAVGDVLSLPLRAGNALLHGTAAAASEIDPSLGRDVYALGVTVPTVLAGTPRPVTVGRGTSRPAEPNLLAPDAAEAPPSNVVSLDAARPAGEPPGPRSVGAAASREMSAPGDITVTPAQEAAYRATAEGQKLLEPQPEGRDPNLYVPGVNPSLAEVEQTVNTSREAKNLGMKYTEVSQDAKDLASANNDARQRYFASVAGSDVDVANARAALRQQDEQMLAGIWRNKGEANAQPVLDVAREIKASEDGKRPLVRGVVDSVIAEMKNADGALETDPHLLYGVRKHLDDLINEKGEGGSKKNERAMGALLKLKGSLDASIEPAAPGFGDYLKAHSSAMRPIEAMEVLQKLENGLYDAQSRMGYAKVQSMMRKIVDSRQAPGVNAFKSITDDQMQQLFALRDDLRRSATAQELAKAPGSDTAQNAWDTIKGVGKTGGEWALQGAANYIAPGVGPIALNYLREPFRAMRAGRNAKRDIQRGLQINRPDPSIYRNPLEP